MYTRGASSASRVAAAGEIRARTAASCRSSITRKSRGDRPPKFMQAIASISFRPRVTRGRAASPPPLAEASARAFSSTSAETPRSVAQLQPVVIVRRTAAGAAMMTGKGLISISRASQSTKRTRSPYKGLRGGACSERAHRVTRRLLGDSAASRGGSRARANGLRARSTDRFGREDDSVGR